MSNLGIVNSCCLVNNSEAAKIQFILSKKKNIKFLIRPADAGKKYNKKVTFFSSSSPTLRVVLFYAARRWTVNFVFMVYYVILNDFVNILRLLGSVVVSNYSIIYWYNTYKVCLPRCSL
uniref:Uncharacterized protein n=1 Tax=Juglanconis juglandina TaxID=1940567 RepID=A0A291LJ11_9PEZI|nr:hypothetical protein [Juglanconis juglandina]